MGGISRHFGGCIPLLPPLLVSSSGWMRSTLADTDNPTDALPQGVDARQEDSHTMAPVRDISYTFLGTCSHDLQAGSDEPHGAMDKLNTIQTTRHNNSQVTNLRPRITMQTRVDIMDKTKVTLEVDRPMSRCNHLQTRTREEKTSTHHPQDLRLRRNKRFLQQTITSS